MLLLGAVGSLGLHDAGRQLSAGLPQVRQLSASGSMDHLQRMGSAPLGPGGSATYSSRGSLPGSLSSGGLHSGVPLGSRMGSGDGGLPGQLRGGVLSAAAARLHSLGSAGGLLPLVCQHGCLSNSINFQLHASQVRRRYLIDDMQSLRTMITQDRRAASHLAWALTPAHETVALQAPAVQRTTWRHCTRRSSTLRRSRRRCCSSSAL